MGADEEPQKRKYHHGNLRPALIEAAAALITEQGADALTLRELARRVGVTHAAPYRHFRDKAALLRAVALQGLTDLVDHLAAATDEPGPTADLAAEGPAPQTPSLPLSPLAIAARRYVDFALQRPALYRLMFAVHIGDDVDRAIGQARAMIFAALQRVVRSTDDGSHDGRPDNQTLAIALWAEVHGLAVLLTDGLLHDGDGASTAAELAAQAVQLLLDGATR